MWFKWVLVVLNVLEAAAYAADDSKTPAFRMSQVIFNAAIIAGILHYWKDR